MDLTLYVVRSTCHWSRMRGKHCRTRMLPPGRQCRTGQMRRHETAASSALRLAHEMLYVCLPALP